MTLDDILTIIDTIARSFGGAVVVVIALSGWLGALWAKRILQKEGATLQSKLEELRHELSLSRSSYEHYLDLILDYYSIFYNHYRFCQRTAKADAHRKPDGQITYTKDEFLSKLNQFLADWAAQEGKIRLLLPSKIRSLHSEAIEIFNRFKLTVDEFREDDDSRKRKEEAFQAVDDVKNRMEENLREFLRTEKLLK